jgi:penicillin-binding protein 1A
MVLGTSNVRLIDMTRAFASVGNNGVAVTPYGITRVTANNRVIYQHEVDTSHVLVANYVAAQMIDLMQTAVATGTGRAAQIGRPVAGKTGTTTSNKDGWFIGFSSGLTTGVWMGRDDAKVIPGLQGGRAPARAFHDFMIQAVANRPVEQFETQLTPPDNMLEPDEDAYGAPDNGMMVDPDGNPIVQPPQVPTEPQDGEEMDDTAPAQQGGRPAPVQQQQGERLDRDWINRMTGRPPAQQQPGRQPQRQPAPQDRQRPNDEY